MENPASPLDTLRQLKEMLDAGALTPAEFEALKQQLVFGGGGLPPVAPPTAPPLPAAVPVPLPPSAPEQLPPANEPLPSPVASVSTFTEPSSPHFQSALRPDMPVAPSTPIAAHQPPTPPTASPSAAAIFPDAVPQSEPEPLPEPGPTWTTAEFLEADKPAARNPLALVLSIGGLLGLLVLVLYLSLNRHPSERLSSTSQTAADLLNTSIDVGPQAAPLPQSAVPETIRVAPTNPAPRIPQRQPTPAPRDSAAVAPSVALPTDSTAGI